MNEENETRNGELVRGHVKWFDPGKGFGFIVPEDGGPDILLHANVLRNFGQSSVADGSGIVVEAQSTPRGIQAVAVEQISPPEQREPAALADLAGIAPEELASAPLEPARVKWFDKGKGFGFANAFGLAEDVFIHVEVLRRSGYADLQPGEAVAIRTTEGKRGRMAMEILSWDAALETGDETQAQDRAPGQDASPEAPSEAGPDTGSEAGSPSGAQPGAGPWPETDPGDSD